jgi:two-component system phosphate regulon response regulator OmpR
MSTISLERRDTHLLVIDDDDRIRDLLKRYLVKQGFRVSAAHDAKSARGLMKTLAFDCLILDVMMPGETGVELATSLRTRSDVPIILLTAMDGAADRIAGLKTGADDYLAKPFEPEELVLRIDAILRRLSARPSQSQNITFGPWEFNMERGDLTQNGESAKLTSGETALLTTLGQRAGVPIARYALAEAIGAKSDRAVDVQVTRLRRKIETNSAEPQYIVTVRGKGYKLMPDML